MQRPDGTAGNTNPILFNLTQKGEKLTGTAGPLPDQPQAIENAVVTDGKATFQVEPGPLYSFTLTIVDGPAGEMRGERDGLVRVRPTVDAARAKQETETTASRLVPIPDQRDAVDDGGIHTDARSSRESANRGLALLGDEECSECQAQ